MEPRDVSFGEVQVREGQTTASATGFLAQDEGKDHPPSTARAIMSCSSTKGCQVIATDTVDSGDWSPNLPPDPWSDGTFTWVIPLEYKRGAAWVQFGAWTHMAMINSEGTMTISKGGLSFSRKWSDPTSTF